MNHQECFSVGTPTLYRRIGFLHCGDLADDDVNFVEAHTFDEAVRAAETTSPDVYLIGHHFDGMRPHRLIRFLRTKPWAASSPIVVVRVLPLREPANDEEEIIT